MQKINDNIYVLIILGIAGAMLLSGGLVYFLVSYFKKVAKQKEELQRAEMEYQAKLFTAVIQSQEEERRRIGKEMHDEVGALLAAVRLNMSSAAMHNETNNAVHENIRSIDKLIGIVRNVSHLLSPPELEYYGFHDAVQSLCDSFTSNNKIKINLTDDAPGFIPKNNFQLSLSLYRILQELITNTIKHASASSIYIHIKKEEENFVMMYNDNGNGFDMNAVQSTGVGLQNIQSRVLMIHGAYTMESAPDKGFMFVVKLAAKG